MCFKIHPRIRPVPEIVWTDPNGTVKFRARTWPKTRNLPPPPQCIANFVYIFLNAVFHDCMQRSVNKYIKKQIHQGLAISQGKRRNIYQLWKFMNIRCSGRIHSAEFIRLGSGSWPLDWACTIYSFMTELCIIVILCCWFIWEIIKFTKCNKHLKW